MRLGEFISSFRSRITNSLLFHKKNDDTTIIKLTPLGTKKRERLLGKKAMSGTKPPAWGLSVTRNSSQTFKLPIEAGESVVLEELFKSYIGECFGCEYEKLFGKQTTQEQLP